MLKKIACLLLGLLFVASSLLLVGCKDDGETSSTVSTEISGAEFLTEEKNWGGETVTIVTQKKDITKYSHCQIDAEATEGEPVNDAFFERNALINEKYGIDIVAVYPEGDENTVTMLRDDMTSGLNDYDAIVCPLYELAPLGIEDLLVDFKSIDNGYIHINEAWWDQKLIEDLNINGHVYFLSGDALVDDDEATWAMYFNKDLIQSHGLEDPFVVVRENRWTLDKMYEMLQNVSLTNGATKSYDPEVGDQWGMVMQSYDYYIFMQSCDQTLVDNTGDKPVMRIDSERNIQVYEKLANIILDGQNVGVADFFGAWDSGVYGQEGKIFANGNALFMPQSILAAGGTGLREAEIHYGIIPMPKADDLQEKYTTGVNVYRYCAFGIPKTNTAKLDVTCYAMEAMAYYGKLRVTPEYYDRTLSLKRFDDDDSSEMLELIFSNRTSDMGAVFNFNAGVEGQGMLYFYASLLGQKTNNLMSTFESKKGVYQTGIDNLIALCYND